ncbi:MAG: hypothetical protein AB7N71_08575 [Phycisphaerae bacterium]
MRFRGAWLAGAALLALGTLGMIPHAQSINYYRYAPFATLIGAANIGLSGAIEEFKSRIMNEALSPFEYDELAQRALKIQRDDPIDAVYFKGWMELLVHLNKFSKLSNAQVAQMDAQRIREVVVEPRLVVRRGDVLPVRVHVIVTLEDTRTELNFDRITVDQENVHPEPDDPLLMVWSQRVGQVASGENPSHYELLFPFAEPKAIVEMDIRFRVSDPDPMAEYRRGALRLYADMINADPSALDALQSEENKNFFQTLGITLEEVIAFAKNPGLGRRN